MFFGFVILLSFIVTNPIIYSFTLKVVLFENSNRTLSFDSWNENNEWSSAAIKKRRTRIFCCKNDKSNGISFCL